MTLLFDHNISRKLISKIVDAFPGSAHISAFNLQKSDDKQIWEFAITNGFTIVSKDNDFHQLSFLYGPPPKVIWIQRGNCSTLEVETILRTKVGEIKAFHDDRRAAFLILP